MNVCCLVVAALLLCKCWDILLYLCLVLGFLIRVVLFWDIPFEVVLILEVLVFEFVEFFEVGLS